MAKDLVRISLDPSQRLALKEQILLGRAYAERVSACLALHLSHLYVNRGDFFAVLDELDFLEQSMPKLTSSTKPATQFEQPPLNRFWHKHYSSARHIAHNIGNCWGLSKGGPGNQKLDRMLKRLCSEYSNDPERFASELAHVFTVDAYLDRAELRDPRQREARLTGDWIVFAKYKHKKYYLVLATHEEAKPPQRLYETLVRTCAAEFPFLFE